MEFRKAETGYLDLMIESLDMGELIKYTSDYFVDIAQQKKITFTINIHPDVNSWSTDRSAFEKILFNLLSNAFKYTPEQGYVNLEITLPDDTLQINITNSGLGIKEEDKSLVFNRFRILDRFETQVLKGFETRTGIRLALCKTLVDLLKGTIEIDSKINEYTSFILRFPPLKESSEKSTNASKHFLPYNREERINETNENEIIVSELSSFTSNIAKGMYSILIVDDDKEIRELLADILQDQYHILLAAGGTEALQLLQTSIPELIICDIIMPEMNGIEFIEKIKQQEMTAHIPVILLSSEVSIESQIEGIEIGIDASLTKPFHSKYLEVTIERLLSNRQDLKLYFDSPASSIENMNGKLIHKEKKEFIIKLTKIVSDNMENEKLSLDMLPGEMGISKMQLYRKLKEINGETPTEFIRNIRLKYAEKLLKTTQKTVQEIMYLCGFNNKAHFYRQFAKEYNQTPKEYRISFQKE